MFDYPLSPSFGTLLKLGIGNSIRIFFGYLAVQFFKRKERSLEDFYINRFGRPLYSMFFEDYTEKLWGVHPSKIAPDWGAQRVKELSLGKVIADFLRHLRKKGPDSFGKRWHLRLKKWAARFISDRKQLLS